MFLSLLILIGIFSISNFRELINFLLLLDNIWKILHESLLVDALLSLLCFFQITDTLIVGMSTTAIDVLPILFPLLSIKKFVLKGIQRSNNLIILNLPIQAGVEFSVSLLLDEGFVVFLGCTVPVFLLFLLLFFYFYYVLTVVFDTLDLKASLLLFHFL